MRVFLVLVMKIKRLNVIWVALRNLRKMFLLWLFSISSIFPSVCVCVRVSARRDAEGCVCVSTTAYLFHPGHSANTHCKEPLVVIQAITELQKKGKRRHRGWNNGIGDEARQSALSLIIFPDTSAFWHVLPGACHSVSCVTEEINNLFWEGFDGILTANPCCLLGQALRLHGKKIPYVPAIVAWLQ